MKILIKQATVVNEGSSTRADVLIENGRIVGIDHHIRHTAERRIDADGLHLLPGIIDDQVHFREPGLTHKATIGSESRAAVAGGVTSFMEMPNVNPPTLTQTLLEEKYAIAARTSLANYSFFMGAGNDNLAEVLRTDPRRVCGVKVFMGSSTGNMLVDNPAVLEALFRDCKLLIATHCEDETTVKANEAAARLVFGESPPMEQHPLIRSVEACYLSSSMAVDLARKHNTRLHILHISTADELALFDNTLPLAQKRITAEACVHHLCFNSDDYAQHGSLIKCNPAIKGAAHQAAIWAGLLDDRLDIIATDHAPHTWAEKHSDSYFTTPSGVPLVQHSLNMMLEKVQHNQLSLERMVAKMCHAPADCFRVEARGYLREGYWADAVLVDVDKKWTVEKSNIHYHCGWSPFEGHTFKGQVQHTLVSGHLAYSNGVFFEDKMGERLLFSEQ
jgi:dihydroorotase